MSLKSKKDLLHLAESAALLAGHKLKAHQADWSKIVSEQGRDIKLKADALAETLILSHLKTATPFPILTEETGWHKGDHEKWVWIIDPLDGSFNYRQGLPFCCVAIALVEDAHPILGAIYDFNRDELFSGGEEVGAFLNYSPIAVSKTNQQQNAVLNTGFSARSDYSPTAIQDFYQEIAPWKKIRMFGSAALALAYVAAGRSDAYHEVGPFFWDVAAGCAIVKAAGGEFDIKGDVFKKPLDVKATNGKVNF